MPWLRRQQQLAKSRVRRAGRPHLSVAPIALGSRPQRTTSRTPTVGVVRAPGVGGLRPAAPAPMPLVAAPAPVPAAGPPAPALPTIPQQAYKDAEYLGWEAQAQRKLEGEKIRLDAEDTGDQAARGEAIRRLLQQRPEDLKVADVSHNKSGLFYSGMLGKARDQIEGDYVRRQADTHSEFDQRRAARDAARRALEEGHSLEEAAQLAAAADRGISRDSDWAEANALAPVPEAERPTPAARAAASASNVRKPSTAQHVAHQAASVARRTQSARAEALHRARKKRPR